MNAPCLVRQLERGVGQLDTVVPFTRPLRLMLVPILRGAKGVERLLGLPDRPALGRYRQAI